MKTKQNMTPFDQEEHIQNIKQKKIEMQNYNWRCTSLQDL